MRRKLPLRRKLPWYCAPALLLAAACAETPIAEPEALDPQLAQFGGEGSGTPFLNLTILHNNDGESELLPDADGHGGVARFATVVRQLRADGSADLRGRIRNAVLTVSSGDNFLAGTEFNASLARGVPFFDAVALDLIGYDAIAIGNHEFDFGPDVLADFIESFSAQPAPFLSSNLDVSGEARLASLEGGGRIARSTVVELGRGIRVGVIGATTPALPFVSSPRNVVVSSNVAGAIMAEVGALRANGVKFIVLISHLQSVEEDLGLIPLLDDVDVVVAGGGDELLADGGDALLPGDAADVFGSYPLDAYDADGTYVPVVTTSGQYRYVGRLVVAFDELGNVLNVGDASGPVAVFASYAPDAAVQEQVIEPLVAAIDELGDDVILATSNVVLDGVRRHLRTRETNQGNLIADAHLWQVTRLASSNGLPAPDVALQNGGGIRNDSEIPAGTLTRATTEAMLPFANFMALVPNVSRDQFREILENAVSRVEFVDGRFAQIAGFRFEYSTSGTAQVLDASGNVVTPGTRVRNVWLNDGTPIVADGAVVPGAPLNVATIDFLASGGDQYPFRGAPFTSFTVSYREALESFLVGGLNGSVTQSAYPVGGEGRIVQIP